MYDIIVIGAGVAGLTSAIYARRANKKVLVLESKAYGGQILNALDIENYPAFEHISGFDLVTNICSQAINLGAKINLEEATSILKEENNFLVVTKKNSYATKTVILATGLQNRKLGLDNEHEYIGKGISYCATCDGSFYKNKNVAIVGGGNSAFYDALYLADIASNVYLIHRSNEFRADDILIDEVLKRKNVKVIYNSNVIKINGDKTLDNIDIINKEGNQQKLDISGLFVAIGHVPQNELFAKLVELDENGYVLANEDCQTSEPGIFVAGDIRKKNVRQLVSATSDGAVAAINAVKYINNHK